MTMATLVVGDDGVTIGQFSPLVKPHPLPACESVHEDYRLALAGDAVGKLDIVEANAARGLSHGRRRGSHRSRNAMPRW